MMYISGVADHKVDNDKMIEHIVELVEKKAEELEAERASGDDGALAKAS